MTTASADVPLKGLAYLLEALAKLRTRLPGGPPGRGGRAPPEPAPLAQTIERLGLEGAVTFRPGVSDAELVELYAEASVVAVPSLYEGFSLPAVEAMACEVPVVATCRRRALPEVVGPDGQAALLVPPADPGALAAALGRVLSDAGGRAPETGRPPRPARPAPGVGAFHLGQVRRRCGRAVPSRLSGARHALGRRHGVRWARTASTAHLGAAGWRQHRLSGAKTHWRRSLSPDRPFSVLTVRYGWLGLPPGERLLDFGCGGRPPRPRSHAAGRGGHRSRLRPQGAGRGGAWVLAMLDAGQGDGRCGRPGPRSWRATDLALPFPDGCFDKVIAAEVLEHVPDDAVVLAELARVLRPGGVIAVTVPRWFPEAVNWALSAEYHNVPGGHVRIYRHGQLRRAPARGAGLVPYRHHHAHALHSPYWWLRCALGPDSEDNPVVKAYHRLPGVGHHGEDPLTRWPEAALNPVLGKSLVVYARQGRWIRPGSVTRALAAAEVRQTAAWIASVQLADGMVPWYPGGHADPWNHVEAAMALAAGGTWAEARAGFRVDDGQAVAGRELVHLPRAGGVIEPRRDPNTCAYVATAAWWCAQLSAGTRAAGSGLAHGRAGRRRGACITKGPAGKLSGRSAPTVCPVISPSWPPARRSSSPCPAPPASPQCSATKRTASAGAERLRAWRLRWPTRPQAFIPEATLGDGLVLPGADGRCGRRGGRTNGCVSWARIRWCRGWDFAAWPTSSGSLRLRPPSAPWPSARAGWPERRPSCWPGPGTSGPAMAATGRGVRTPSAFGSRPARRAPIRPPR